VMQSWIVSIITQIFSVTWSFRNHFNTLICCSRNIYWKQLCCLIFFVEIMMCLMHLFQFQFNFLYRIVILSRKTKKQKKFIGCRVALSGSEREGTDCLLFTSVLQTGLRKKIVYGVKGSRTAAKRLRMRVN